jgi:hypothetical protein
MSVLPNTLTDIITKVRRITGRPSPTQIADSDIIKYINTFYLYDMPEHLRLESLRVNYEFLTTANVSVYDFPVNSYLTVMPPVFIAGYQSYMTQSRENFFRINPELNFLQQDVTIGNGTTGPYTGTIGNAIIGTIPAGTEEIFIIPGYKPNPPGNMSIWAATNDIPANQLKWNVLFSALGAPNAISGIPPSISLIDDGQGNLFAVTDTTINPAFSRGTINYITGAFTIYGTVNPFGNPGGFTASIPIGNPINAQYCPYVPSRPQSCVFYQDQIILYPIPDQAYTVSFECYQYPAAFLATNPSATPQLNEWWQYLAYGAADKIFADNGDFENLQKFRPLLEEQMNLVQRRTIVQQTSERTATIYTEQSGPGQYPFGNNFGGF